MCILPYSLQTIIKIRIHSINSFLRYFRPDLECNRRCGRELESVQHGNTALENAELTTLASDRSRHRRDLDSEREPKTGALLVAL